MMERGPAIAGLGAVAIFCLAIVSPTLANTILVASADDIETALETAGPGDTLLMANGVWTDQEIRSAGIGNPGNPITLRAQTPGGVILNGSLSCSSPATTSS